MCVCVVVGCVWEEREEEWSECSVGDVCVCGGGLCVVVGGEVIVQALRSNPIRRAVWGVPLRDVWGLVLSGYQEGKS